VLERRLADELVGAADRRTTAQTASKNGIIGLTYNAVCAAPGCIVFPTASAITSTTA
jgi:hypothetical protein